MVNVQITYNPYTVRTEILLNGKEIEDKFSPLCMSITKDYRNGLNPKAVGRNL